MMKPFELYIERSDFSSALMSRTELSKSALNNRSFSRENVLIPLSNVRPMLPFSPAAIKRIRRLFLVFDPSQVFKKKACLKGRERKNVI